MIEDAADRERLRDLIQAGIDSGIVDADVDDIFDELMAGLEAEVDVASAARMEADTAEFSGLVGSIRRLGMAGPPYEVIGFAEPTPDGRSQMLILLIEPAEVVTHTVDDILADPVEG